MEEWCRRRECSPYRHIDRQTDGDGQLFKREESGGDWVGEGGGGYWRGRWRAEKGGESEGKRTQYLALVLPSVTSDPPPPPGWHTARLAAWSGLPGGSVRAANTGQHSTGCRVWKMFLGGGSLWERGREREGREREMGERERQRQTDRQRLRHTDTQTDIHTDTDRETDRHTDTQSNTDKRKEKENYGDAITFAVVCARFSFCISLSGIPSPSTRKVYPREGSA